MRNGLGKQTTTADEQNKTTVPDADGDWQFVVGSYFVGKNPSI